MLEYSNNLNFCFKVPLHIIPTYLLAINYYYFSPINVQQSGLLILLYILPEIKNYNNICK